MHACHYESHFGRDSKIIMLNSKLVIQIGITVVLLEIDDKECGRIFTNVVIYVNNKFTKQRPELHPVPVQDRLGSIWLARFPRQTVATSISLLPQTTSQSGQKLYLFLIRHFFSIFCRHGWPGH